MKADKEMEPAPQALIEVSFPGDPMLEPFTGDPHIAARLLELREEYGIVNAVETGTYLGHTFIWFCNHFANVHSCEISAKNYQFACHAIFGQPGAALEALYPEEIVDPPGMGRFVLKNQDSVEFIRGIADTLEGETVFFLDAHWYDRCPLPEELDAIAAHGLRPAVIAIHDFYTDHPEELGYDVHHSQPFTLEWIRPALEKIYGTAWSHEYNTPARAGGARRGIVYIKRTQRSDRRDIAGESPAE